MKNYIVKVRSRQGTSSKDLTIPAELAKEYNIVQGDVFKPEVIFENNELKIVYSLIYKNNKNP